MVRANRQSSPEGTRGLPTRRRARRPSLVSLGALVLFAASIAVAVGDETASLTVTNLTSHHIVVVVTDQTFPNVAPGAAAVYRTSRADTVAVRVSYLAGQGIEGSAQRSFYLSPGHPTGGSGTTVYFACSTSAAILAPGNGGPIDWKVTADSLATR